MSVESSCPGAPPPSRCSHRQTHTCRAAAERSKPRGRAEATSQGAWGVGLLWSGRQNNSPKTCTSPTWNPGVGSLSWQRRILWMGGHPGPSTWLKLIA